MSLTEIERNNIIRLKQLGYSNIKIASIMHCHKSTVGRLIKKYNLTSSLKDLAKPGAPPKISERIKRILIRKIMKRELIFSKDIKLFLLNTYQIDVSIRTVQRLLLASNFRYRRLVPKHKLNQQLKSQRYEFACQYRHYTREDWEGVVFSDETTINEFSKNVVPRRWTTGERLASGNVIQRDRGSGRKCNIWSCVTSSGVGYISVIEGNLNSNQYVEIILDNYTTTLAYYGTTPRRMTLVQDNCPVHTSVFTKDQMRRNHIGYMNVPPYSPDINIIENLWAELKRRVALKVEQGRPEDFSDLIVETWEEMDDDNLIDGLYDSIPERLRDIRRCKGGYTKY